MTYKQSIQDADVASGAAIAWAKVSKTGAVASDVSAAGTPTTRLATLAANTNFNAATETVMLTLTAAAGTRLIPVAGSLNAASLSTGATSVKVKMYLTFNTAGRKDFATLAATAAGVYTVWPTSSSSGATTWGGMTTGATLPNWPDNDYITKIELAVLDNGASGTGTVNADADAARSAIAAMQW